NSSRASGVRGARSEDRGGGQVFNRCKPAATCAVISGYFTTVMVRSSSAVRAPSSARQRRTYVPGSLKVTVTGTPPSAGRGGAVHKGAHGEFAPARVSSHALTCAGSNVTFAPAGPRYRNHDTCSPRALPTVIRVGGTSAPRGSRLGGGSGGGAARPSA